MNYIPVLKPDTIRDLGPIDLMNAVNIVQNLSPSLWQLETNKRENDYFCFTETSHMIFIFADGVDPQKSRIKPLWSLVSKIFEPLIEQAIRPYGYHNGVIVKAMLAKLQKHGKIDMHKDYIRRDQYVHKIHIPLITNANAIFHIEEEDFHLELGHAYEVNNMKKHGVTNGGDEDRTHFIFEYFDAPLE